MAKNKTLSNAKKAKKDEFYTQLVDIENELKHYKQHFIDKVVLCNCDDPYESNFFKYFAANFNHLRLKKLIATCYDPSPIAGRQLEWGHLYELYSSGTWDAAELETEVARLMADSDVKKKKGIYSYVFDHDEHHLDIRAFDDNTKREVYEKQKGVCKICGKVFKIEEMEADHITPWRDGGRTIADNCQMLCRECNRRKSGK